MLIALLIYFQFIAKIKIKKGLSYYIKNVETEEKREL
jgi:hypothetical protein